MAVRVGAGYESSARCGSGGKDACATAAAAAQAQRMDFKPPSEAEPDAEPSLPFRVRRVGQRRAAGDARDLAEGRRGYVALRVRKHAGVEHVADLDAGFQP